MANPYPYFLIGSSITERFVMFAFAKMTSAAVKMTSVAVKVASVAATVVGKTKVVMCTTAGLTLSYGVYQTLIGGNTYVRRASNAGKKKKMGKKHRLKMEALAKLELLKLPRHGLTPRPDDALYLDLAATERCQPCVLSHDKAHALFLWIKVKQEADHKEVACTVARLQQLVQRVEAPTVACCGCNQISAGVGFGPEFYHLVKGGPPQPFNNCKHSLISGSSVGGDILIHAKSNNEDQLKMLGKYILETLPEDCVLCHEETLGGHDVPQGLVKQPSGKQPLGVVNYDVIKQKQKMEAVNPDFKKTSSKKPNILFVRDTGIDDTEPRRWSAAVDPRTGGSYVMTQKWVHDVSLRRCNGDTVMNQWVDKAWEECAGPPDERKFKSRNVLSAELANRSIETWMADAYRKCLDTRTKHKKHKKDRVKCTRGLPPVHTPFRILRESVPYDDKGGLSGMFFISYASTPKYNELLLDRLITSACGGGKLNSACQNVFRLSHNVRSACWYFPGLVELKELE